MVAANGKSALLDCARQEPSPSPHGRVYGGSSCADFPIVAEMSDFSKAALRDGKASLHGIFIGKEF
jgi:hypothetical protein